MTYHKAIETIPSGGFIAGGSRRNEVRRQRSGVVNLYGDCNRLVKAIRVEGRRDVGVDGDVAATLDGVESVEAVLTAPERSASQAKPQLLRTHVHAGTCTGREVLISASARPWCHSGQGATVAWQLNPADAIHRGIRAAMRRFDRYASIALNKA